MSAMPPLDWANDPVDVLRDAYEAERRKLVRHCPADVEISEVDFVSGLGLCFTPEAPSGADILYFHGGGWIVGSPWTHRNLCAWLAKFTGRRVFAAPYRLAPEHKFPAQAEDAGRILDEFATSRDQVIVAGDSAGGAMTLWAAAGCATPEKITALVSLYGAFGYLESASMTTYGAGSEGLTAEAVLAMYTHLGARDVTDFRAHLSKAGAPLLLVRAECDPLADDNDWLAEHTQHPITYLLAPGQPHAFLQFATVLPGVRGIMADIAKWLNARV